MNSKKKRPYFSITWRPEKHRDENQMIKRDTPNGSCRQKKKKKLKGKYIYR